MIASKGNHKNMKFLIKNYLNTKFLVDNYLNTLLRWKKYGTIPFYGLCFHFRSVRNLW